MTVFDQIVGHKTIISHLKNGIVRDKLSHCYLFCGEDGIGKRMVAKAFAQMLLCENTDGAVPCGVCPGCVSVERENHPDLRFVTHEKPATFGVEDVREGLNGDIFIRPYKGKKKIYILDDAQLLNTQAQNAILKTIEEPPDYALIILLTNNREAFLETIRSRSVTVEFQALKNNQVETYLRNRYNKEEDINFALSFSCGNIGKAIALMEDEAKKEMLNTIIGVLKKIYHMPMDGVIDALRSLTEYKDQTEDLLAWMLLWYRDVLVYKTMKKEDFLLYKMEIFAIKEAAKQYTFQELNDIFEEIKVLQNRLRANVNFELALEMLLLKARALST